MKYQTNICICNTVNYEFRVIRGRKMHILAQIHQLWGLVYPIYKQSPMMKFSGIFLHIYRILSEFFLEKSE